MRFFIYEYVSAGVDPAQPASLQREGRAMLQAVAEDFTRLASAEVRTLTAASQAAPLVQDQATSCSSRDGCHAFAASLEYVVCHGIQGPRKHATPADIHNRSLGPAPGCRVEVIPPDGEERAFRRLARWADFTLVIAPEFDDLLATRCRWVEEENGRLLGPSSQAVALTGDKLALAVHLSERGVRTLPCTPLSAGPAQLAFPLVCKPRFGAGSQATFLVRHPTLLADCLATARAEGWRGELILQPFVSGMAASVAFLRGPHQTVALAPVGQHVSTDGRFHYHGGEVPLPAALAGRASRSARAAVDAVPGLCGYVGVDVVLGDSPDGSADWVIEINPRLTTSYLGLRALAEDNLAEMLVRIVRGDTVAPPRWRRGPIRFRADGAIRAEPDA